ncbi:MAG: hypothetical protein WCW44_00140 [archaeon]
MDTLIIEEFEEVMLNYSKHMRLDEFVEFAKQLEEAGYVFSVNTTSKGITLIHEKPSFRLILRRIIAKITSKRLKLTKWQTYMLKEKVHYNYKPFSRFNTFLAKPNWVTRAINFKVKNVNPKSVELYTAKRPDWVVSAIKFWKNKQRC